MRRPLHPRMLAIVGDVFASLGFRYARLALFDPAAPDRPTRWHPWLFDLRRPVDVDFVAEVLRRFHETTEDDGLKLAGVFTHGARRQSNLPLLTSEEVGR